MNGWAETLLDVAAGACDSGRLAEADALLRLLVGRGASDIDVLHRLGRVSLLRGRLLEAAWFLGRAVSLGPAPARAHSELGAALRLLGDAAAAEAHIRRALELDPALPHAHGNLAITLLALGRADLALRIARAALRDGADPSVAQHDLGRVLLRLGRPQDALPHFAAALALNPADHGARHAQGLARLSLGEMPAAWDDFEARLHLLPTDPRYAARPRWQAGEPVAGRTILLHPDGDSADSIQFLRYVPLLTARGALVVLELPPGLMPLCRFPGVRVIAAGTAPPDFDLHCPLNSLPAMFRTDLATIPAETPYLTVDAGISAAWAGRLGPWNRMRVGLAWSAPRDADGLCAAVPAEALLPLLQRTDIECHVVQRAPGAPAAWDGAAIEHTEELTGDSHLAGLLANMDLVITADNDIAHLAGALAIPTWVMLPYGADWRWLRGRDDSPWYPGLRLFRQKRRGDWASVLAAVGRNLDQWAIRRS